MRPFEAPFEEAEKFIADTAASVAGPVAPNILFLY
jgi:hypothetical protein